ncbi:MAG TPA: ABC transporter permease [Bacteroidales bacterium]|nr:ABC transporter permease [Bacteroidales bacterium]
MNTGKIAVRKLFRRGEHTITRIISLAAGLAFGIILLSEVFYHFSFDSFYPHSSRIYVVHENYRADNSSDKLNSNNRVSGAIGPGLKAEVPGVEAASRLNSLGPSIFYIGDDKSFNGYFSFADENVFDVLPRPMITGNPKEILSDPMKCMVSDRIAEMFGGEIIGKTIELKEYPGKILTVAGIFKALPENTNFRYDALISMVSTGQFMWDGTDNWMGNDRYYTCVRLEPGVNPESLATAVRKMQEVHQDIKSMEAVQKGMVLKYSFVPIKQIHVADISEMLILLSGIACAVLLVSLLNYILLTMSSLINRAKTSAIYKTYGAGSKDLQLMIFLETVVLFAISLFGSFILITSIQKMIETQSGHTLSSMINPVVVWPVLFTLVAILLVISYLPGRFYSKIPVATVFHEYHNKGNKWKLALLSLQFAGATFVLAVLIISSMQYDKTLSADHGYQSKNIYYGSTSGMTGAKLPTVVNELRSLPQVEKVGIGYSLPVDGASGNNIRIPGEDKDLFNVADFYWVDENYFSILNIPVIEGTEFSPETCVQNDFLISRKGAEMLLVNTGWKDGVVGKQILLTEHGTNTIRGIFPDFTIHSFIEPDLRPAVFSFAPESIIAEGIQKRPSLSFNILVRTYDGTPADITKKIADIMNLGLPYKDAVVKSLETEKAELYSTLVGFRSSMLSGSVVVLLITFLGLLGYTITEASRRSKELAIRKISGASLGRILKIFIRDLELIAIPAVLTGLILAWLGIEKWMENFALKTPVYWWVLALCGLAVLLFVVIVSVLNYIIIANRNPVEALKYE